MVYPIKDDRKFKMMLPLKYELIYSLGVSTGLRISDIVKIEKSQVSNNKRPTITAQKTGKKKRIYINKKVAQLIASQIALDKTGSIYLFPSIKDPRLHITRQAVYKVFSRAAKECGIDYSVGTHCMRKKYAHKQFSKSKGDIFAVQKAMQHDKLADSALYLMEAPKK